MKRGIAKVAAVAAGIVLVAGAAQVSALSAPSPKTFTGPATLCGSGDRAVVRSGHRPPYYIRNAFWDGKGNACIRTNGSASFRVLKTPGPSKDVVAFPDITQGCHWWHCTRGTAMPLPVRRIKRMQSYAATRNRPPGSWDKAYDLWFGKQRQAGLHPNGAELMVWNDQHGRCCGLASNATKVRIDGKLWWRSHWRMHERGDRPHGHVHWNYIQYRLVHPRRAIHVNLADFIHDAVRINQIDRSWWLECAEYGFEVWQGGIGLRLTHYRLHLAQTTK